MKELVFIFIVLPAIASSQAVNVTLKEFEVPPNGVVRISNIGFNLEALSCLTSYTKCCRSSDTTSSGGNGTWILPDGSSIAGIMATPSDLGFYRSRNLQQVNLNRRNEANEPTGIFRCMIPTSETEFTTVLVGVYNDTTNYATMDSLKFMVTTDSNALVPVFNLTCTSTGGPVDSGLWTNGSGVVVSQSVPVLTDGVSATYESVLSSTSSGTYSCLFFIRDGQEAILRNITSLYTVQAVEPPTEVEAIFTPSLGSISVTWVAPASQTPPVLGYRLFYSVGGRSMVVVIDDPSASQHTIEPGQEIDNNEIQIRAETNPTLGLPSMLITVTITAPPTDKVTTDMMITTQEPEPEPIVVEVTNTSLVVGSMGSLKCTTNSTVDTIDWIDGAGNVLASTETSNTLSLTFNPVLDNITSNGMTYTCRVTKGNRTTTKTIEVNPAIPSQTLTISVARSVSGSSVAGSVLVLTCSVNEAIAGLTNMPTVLWTRNNQSVLLDDGSLSMMATVQNDTSIISVLTFNPLSTSHAGVYVCRGSLATPLLGATINDVVESEVISVTIPAPDVNVDMVSNTSVLYGGSPSPLVLRCSVTLNNAVNENDIILDITWMDKNRTALTNSTQRVSISQTSISGSVFDSLLSILPPRVGDMIFMCLVVASPAQSVENITESSPVEASGEVTVRAPSNPIVSIDRSGTPTATAGSTNYTLTCIVKLLDPLITQPVPAIEWINPSGISIQNGSDFSVSFQSPATSVLRFIPLRTSQGGSYTCRASVTVDIAQISITGMRTEDVIVKIAAPTSVEIRPSRNPPIYEGTPLNITCTATINTSVVDTDISVNITLDVVQSSNRVTVTDTAQRSDSTFERTVIFRVLMAMSDNRDLSCQVMVQPVEGNAAYLRGSNTASKLYSLTVMDIPLPEIVISMSPSSLLGQPFTLTCTVSVIAEITTSTPTLQWTYPNGTTSNSPGNLTSSIIFDSLMVSDAGRYVCTVSIVFSGAIPQRMDSRATDVRVQLPPPEVTITTTSSTPIAGTNVLISCLANLSSITNTVDFTVQGTWLKGSTNLSANTNDRIIASPSRQTYPYDAQLQFSPLGSGMQDGGVYTCDVQVIPQGDSFVVSSMGTSTYELIIQDYPEFPLTISYDQGSCDNQASIIPSSTLLDNTSTTRTLVYEWMDPGNSAISSEPGRVSVSQDGVLHLEGITPQDEGDYTLIGCLSIPQSNIERLCSTLQVSVSTDVPSEVSTLLCDDRQNPNAMQRLTFTWSLPETNPTSVVAYLVTVLMYTQNMDSRNVLLVNLSTPFIRKVESSVFTATVTASVDMYIPYEVSVTPLNLDGCGRTRSIDCFTKEGVPSKPPDNLKPERLNDTSFSLTWQRLTIVEAKGLIHYIIYYQKSSSLGKRETDSSPLQNKTIDGNENGTVISGLESGVEYAFAIGTINSNGDLSESSPYVRELTSATTTTTTIIIVVVLVFFAVLITILGIIVIIASLFLRSNQLFKYRSHIDQEHLYEVQAASMEMTSDITDKDGISPEFPPHSETWKETEATIEESLGIYVTSPEMVMADYTKVISKEKFRNHVLIQHRENNSGFEMEYKSLESSPVESYGIAKLPLNNVKNRFANIFPYDHSRIMLNPLHAVECSDYINACTIDGYNRSQCYIASQGPLKNTIGDFWRMVWEKDVSKIVMLTNCTEAGRNKCEQYWSENFGGELQTPDRLFSIRTLSITHRADYVIRDFSLTNLVDIQTRPAITQYHFTSWPDHGVPKHASILLNFIRQVQKCHNKNEGRPLLVHCSAGVGRTGTFITLDSMLEMIAAEDSVDIYNFVMKMRERRILMVQTLSQYIFIHDALEDFITCGNTLISVENLRKRLKLLRKVVPRKEQTGFHIQFELLDTVSKKWNEEDISNALESNNREKNRYLDILPYNLSRVYLNSTPNYINASFIDGYKQRNAYIATQGPLKDTVGDFWTMIQHTRTQVIIMLCKLIEDEEESCYPYWPAEEEVVTKYEGVSVKLLSNTPYEDFTVLSLEVSDSNARTPNTRIVTLFHYSEWPRDRNPKTGTLFEMMELISKRQMVSSDQSPLTVICNNGVSRTGAFISLHSQMEQLKTEACIDIFQFVKSARLQRPHFVSERNMYEYVYEAIVDFIHEFDGYANFKDVI